MPCKGHTNVCLSQQRPKQVSSLIPAHTGRSLGSSHMVHVLLMGGWGAVGGGESREEDWKSLDLGSLGLHELRRFQQVEGATGA